MRALLLLIALAGVAHAQPQEMAPNEIQAGPLESEPPFVELYTFGPGELIFERFGHATICLRYHDPAQHPSVCFNWGVTDFGDGHCAGLCWGL